jgi:hypothetical protein
VAHVIPVNEHDGRAGLVVKEKTRVPPKVGIVFEIRLAHVRQKRLQSAFPTGIEHLAALRELADGAKFRLDGRRFLEELRRGPPSVHLFLVALPNHAKEAKLFVLGQSFRLPS